MVQVSINKTSATVLGLIACIIWSCAVLVVEKLTKGFGPIFGAGVELLIAGAVFAIIILIKGDYKKLYLNSRKYFIYCSILWLSNIIFFWLAMGYSRNDNETVVIGLINYLWPSLTILFSLPILKYKARPSLVLGILLAIMGIILAKFSVNKNLNLFADINYKAYLSILICAIAWGLYSNLCKKYATKGAIGAVPIFMLAGGAILTFYSYINGLVVIPTSSIIVLMFIWAVLTGLSYIAWDFGMRSGNMLLISSASMLIPLFSTLITAYANSIPIDLALIISSVLVVLGAYVCKKSVSEK